MSYTIMRKRLENRVKERQLKIDDIIVFDDDLPANLDDCRLTFVDFAPILKIGGRGEGVVSVQYGELVDFGNKWLQERERWDVLCCETISAIIEIIIDERGEITSKQILSTYSITDDSNVSYVSFHAYTRSKSPVQYRVKILRLWVRPFDPKDYDQKYRPIVPHIQFRDFAPQLLDTTGGGADGGNSSLDNQKGQFETCDGVVAKLNKAIINEEITGKILNIQTLAMSAEQDWSIDGQSAQSKSWVGKTVYILRVFYASGPVHEEEVGLADFVPQCLVGGGVFKKPKFESQSSLLTKASKWLSANPEINFCSSLSLDVKLKSMVSIDTKQMSITRETGDFIRILRIAYTKPRELPADIPISSTLPPPAPVYLQHRVFALHRGYGEVKRAINEFMCRDEWGAQVSEQYKWILLNAETIPVFASNHLRESLETNSDQSFQALLSSNLSLSRTEYFAMKIYYDVGYYGIDHLSSDKSVTETGAVVSYNKRLCYIM